MAYEDRPRRSRSSSPGRGGSRGEPSFSPPQTFTSLRGIERERYTDRGTGRIFFITDLLPTTPGFLERCPNGLKRKREI